MMKVVHKFQLNYQGKINQEDQNSKILSKIYEKSLSKAV
jgi:hypothetical protein